MPKREVSSNQIKSLIIVMLSKMKRNMLNYSLKTKVLKLYCLYQEVVKHEKKHKKMWVSEKFSELERLAHGAHSNLIAMLRARDPDYFFRLMRMSPETFDLLLSYVGPKIAPARGVRQPILEQERLELVLHYLATGSFMYIVGVTFRISEAATHNVINKVCDAIWETLSPIVFEKPSEDMWRRHAKDFEDMWHFPNCVGAIDGKLVQMEVS